MTREPYRQAAHITRGYFGGLSREMAHAAPGERDPAIAGLRRQTGAASKVASAA
jgi:hypothetical protein